MRHLHPVRCTRSGFPLCVTVIFLRLRRSSIRYQSVRLCLEEGVPDSLGEEWRSAVLAELEVAEDELPRLSRAAVELAALVVSGEYNAVAVGDILEGDEVLKGQVIDLANSALYAASDPVESPSVAAQRIGMRGLWELAVIKVARSHVFGPVLESVLGGEQTWKSARIAGAISHRVSSAKLGANRASMLAGLILCAGAPLGHQLVQRVEKRRGSKLSSRMRRELVSRAGPALCLMLARNWSLPPAIEAAAESLAGGRNDLPPNREVQVAVFSTYLGRLLAAQGFDNLSIPLGWPSTLALEIDQRELDDIVALASTAGASAIGF